MPRKPESAFILNRNRCSFSTGICNSSISAAFPMFSDHTQSKQDVNNTPDREFISVKHHDMLCFVDRVRALTAYEAIGKPSGSVPFGSTVGVFSGG